MYHCSPLFAIVAVGGWTIVQLNQIPTGDSNCPFCGSVGPKNDDNRGSSGAECNTHHSASDELYIDNWQGYTVMPSGPLSVHIPGMG